MLAGHAPSQFLFAQQVDQDKESDHEMSLRNVIYSLLSHSYIYWTMTKQTNQIPSQFLFAQDKIKQILSLSCAHCHIPALLCVCYSMEVE